MLFLRYFTLCFISFLSFMQTASSYMRQLNILYAALALGQLIFFVVASQIGGISPELHEMFRYIVPAVLVGAVLGASFLYMNRMTSIKSDQSLSKKLDGYRTANILRWACLESGAMFSLVGYFLTGNVWYAYLFAAALLPFIINRPTLDKCMSQLPLTDREKLILQQDTPF